MPGRSGIRAKRKGQIALRNVRSSDASQVAELMTELGYPTSTLQMASRLRIIGASQDYHSIVAVERKRTVGFVGAMIGRAYERDEPHGRIIVLVVRGTHRRRGIGTLLVAAAEEWLNRRGAVGCAVNSGKSRSDAHRFYASLGYQATGTRFARAVGSTSDHAHGPRQPGLQLSASVRR